MTTTPPGEDAPAPPPAAPVTPASDGNTTVHEPAGETQDDRGERPHSDSRTTWLRLAKLPVAFVAGAAALTLTLFQLHDRIWPPATVHGGEVIAADLVRSKPDLIVAFTPQAVRAVKDATSDIPIVMLFVADPVGVGLASSLAHPGGNLTGVATLVPGAFMGKMLEVLRELLPHRVRGPAGVDEVVDEEPAVAVPGDALQPAKLALRLLRAAGLLRALGAEGRLFAVISRSSTAAFRVRYSGSTVR